MRGHIRKRGAKWAIIVDIGSDPVSGKRQQKWFSGYRTKKDAEKDLASIITKLEENTFVAPKKITLNGYYEYWPENRPAELSPTTITGYNFVFSKHLGPLLGNLEVQNIKHLQIQEYYTEKLKTLSSTTVRHHHSLLRKMLQDAKRWQVIANNPCDNVQVPKVKKYEVTVITLDESKELMKKLAGNFLEVPIHVSMFLGIRRGELLALLWKDFDFQNHTINRQKKSRE